MACECEYRIKSDDKRKTNAFTELGILSLEKALINFDILMLAQDLRYNPRKQDKDINNCEKIVMKIWRARHY